MMVIEEYSAIFIASMEGLSLVIVIIQAKASSFILSAKVDTKLLTIEVVLMVVTIGDKVIFESIMG